MRICKKKFFCYDSYISPFLESESKRHNKYFKLQILDIIKYLTEVITSCSVKARQQPISRKIFGFLKGPIPPSKSTSKDQLTKGFHEEDTPKYSKKID